MFRRIVSIDNFGVFSHFTGGALPDFAPFNIIYGWNYSGKTTLSRVFRCLELGALNPDYPQARFSILADNAVEYSQRFAEPCTVRVFNEDFRKQHLLWDEADGFSPILLLGAENIALSENLAESESQLADAKHRFIQASVSRSVIEGEIGKAETECASQIVKELPVGRFTKANLRPIIAAWKGALPTELSADDVKIARLKVAAEPKDRLPNLKIAVDKVQMDRLWQHATALLSEELGSSGTIDHLVANPEIAQWVEQGLHVHEGKERCEFCEGILGSERIHALNAHFSDAFVQLKRRIASTISKLNAMRVEFSAESYSRSAVYTDLHTEYGESRAQLEYACGVWNKSLDQMINALERKEANPFDVVEAPNGTPDAKALSAAAERFEALIETCNDRTREFEAQRQAAIEIIKQYLIMEHMRRIDRFGKERRILELEEEENIIDLEIRSLNRDITRLQAELSDAARGADAINDTLRRFFGKADIEIRVTDNDRFRLMRGAEPARNLSEGERTAISFCYFITKLLESGNDLSQTIVYIDDPISSLDAHHLMHICAFIRNTFYKRNDNFPRHECLAKQVFISTHSHEFFHLMLDWVTRMTSSMYQAFLVERVDSNGIVASRVIERPESIRKYRSEYLYLFHHLANFAENPENDRQVIFNLGNMARRFVEGYISFKFIEHERMDNRINDLISDPVEAERARKFMHFHSHTLSRNGGMRLPDMSEAQTILNCILNAVREHDPVHYGALEATRQQA